MSRKPKSSDFKNRSHTNTRRVEERCKILNANPTSLGDSGYESLSKTDNNAYPQPSLTFSSLLDIVDNQPPNRTRRQQNQGSGQTQSYVSGDTTTHKTTAADGHTSDYTRDESQSSKSHSRRSMKPNDLSDNPSPGKTRSPASDRPPSTYKNKKSTTSNETSQSDPVASGRWERRKEQTGSIGPKDGTRKNDEPRSSGRSGSTNYASKDIDQHCMRSIPDRRTRGNTKDERGGSRDIKQDTEPNYHLGKSSQYKTGSLAPGEHRPLTSSKSNDTSQRTVRSDPGIRGNRKRGKDQTCITSTSKTEERTRTPTSNHDHYTAGNKSNSDPGTRDQRRSNTEKRGNGNVTDDTKERPRASSSNHKPSTSQRRNQDERTRSGNNKPEQREGDEPKSDYPHSDILTYADTSENRKLDRVGKPVGSMVHSRKTGEITVQRYKDTPLNRRLVRVGEFRGSRPSKKKSALTMKIPEYIQKIKSSGQVDRVVAPDDQEALNIAQCIVNRDVEDSEWAREDRAKKVQEKQLRAKYSGNVIPYVKLDFHKKIGQGGFGEIHLAKLDGMVVAVKTMRATKATEAKKVQYVQQFKAEVINFCGLDNRNIVKFIGASVEKDLSIVMEYMQMSLYDAIHLKYIDFSEANQLMHIQDMCSGLRYMHGDKHMAHCDLKSQNVLLDCVGTDKCTAKLSDFGLSMVEGSQSVRKVGTRRYWAPELHRGERLDTNAMMRTDIFALALIFHELIYEEEPFYDVPKDQLAKHVDEKRQTPDMPEDMKVDRVVTAVLRKCWKHNPTDRPAIQELSRRFHDLKQIYGNYKG